MLTDNYTRSQPLNERITSGAGLMIDRLRKKQFEIASTKYNIRSGNLTGSLSRKENVSINMASFGELDLNVSYPSTIRYLDQRRFANKRVITNHRGEKEVVTLSGGRRKSYYTPIYNKPVTGYIVGSDFSLSSIINQALVNKVKAVYASLSEALNDINV